ncbi:MAG: transposase [Rubritalea sp.]|jgi:transposase
MKLVDRIGKITESKTHNIIKEKRRRNEPEFKARVAIEAVKGIKTIQEIAKEFDVHPVQVSDWKKNMLEGVSDVFSATKKRSTEETFDAQREQLHAKIGQQAVEIDFLVKKSKQFGL